MEELRETMVPDTVFQAIPLLIDFPVQRFSVDYDREVDVLYISFQRPQKATNTELTDDGLLLRYRNKQLVGVTVLDASTWVRNGRVKADQVVRGDA